MNNSITQKTMVAVTKLGDFWVSVEQAQKIMQAKEHEPDSIINLEGCFIGCRNIDGILTAEKYDELNCKRRGAWQCGYHHWHERYQPCDHDTEFKRAFRNYTDHAAP